MLELLGFESILDVGDLLKLVVRFCIDLGFIALVVRGTNDWAQTIPRKQHHTAAT